MAGEAARKLKAAVEDVTFDFSRPELHMATATRKAYARREVEQNDLPNLCAECGKQTPLIEENPAMAVPRAVRNTILSVVNATFPVDPRTGQGGMTRKDGRIYSAWQETLDDVWDLETVSFTIPRLQADWLRKLFEDEKVALNPAIAQWREAILEYLGNLEPANVAPFVDESAS